MHLKLSKSPKINLNFSPFLILFPDDHHRDRSSHDNDSNNSKSRDPRDFAPRDPRKPPSNNSNNYSHNQNQPNQILQQPQLPSLLPNLTDLRMSSKSHQIPPQINHLLPALLQHQASILTQSTPQYPPSLMTNTTISQSIPKVNANDPRASRLVAMNNYETIEGRTSPAAAATPTAVPHRRRDPRLLNGPEFDCILMENLPSDMGEWDVEEYLRGIGIIPDDINLVMDSQMRPTREGICEFSTHEQARKAAKLDNVNIGNCNVKIHLISRKEAKEKLDPHGSRVIKSSNQQQDDRHDGNNQRYPSGSGLAYQSPPNDGGMNGNPRYGGNSNQRNGGGGGPSGPNNLPIEGRVILLENIPYKATIEDILEFFGREYNLTPDHVRRRFNERGQPAGEAKVLFNTPDACSHAFNTRRGQMMMNRRVFLKMQ